MYAMEPYWYVSHNSCYIAEGGSDTEWNAEGQFFSADDFGWACVATPDIPGSDNSFPTSPPTEDGGWSDYADYGGPYGGSGYGGPYGGSCYGGPYGGSGYGGPPGGSGYGGWDPNNADEVPPPVECDPVMEPLSFTVDMTDTYGDGWNGAKCNVDCAMPPQFELVDFVASGQAQFTLHSTQLRVVCTPGDYAVEPGWTIHDANMGEVASGGSMTALSVSV